MPTRLKKKNFPTNSKGKILFLMTGWARRLAAKLSAIVINAESHLTHIPIVRTMAVIYFLFNAKIAQKNMMPAAVKNATQFTTCPKVNKKNYAKER